MKISFVVNVLLLTLLSTSCGLSGADNDPEPKDYNPYPAVNELLMGRHWVTTAETTIIVSGNDSTFRNSYADIAACSFDDFLEFKPNNVLIQDNGPDKCVPFVPQTLTGSWCTSNKGNTITFTYGSLSSDLDILNLTSQQLVLREIHYNEPKQGQTKIIISTSEPR